MQKIRYMIADDHTLFREGLRMVLSNDERLELAGDAGDGEELLMRLKTDQPDIILLDLTMPGMDGIKAIKIIREQYPDIKILIVTMSDDPQLIIYLLELGANGYLMKNADSAEIRLAIHTCMEQGNYFNNRVATLMHQMLLRPKRSLAGDSNKMMLNEREQTVLQLITEGLTATEIGKKVFLSPRTIEGIRANLLGKTQTKNLAELIMYAAKHKLLP